MPNYVKGLPLKFVKYPLTFMGQVNFGEDDAGYDVYFYGETSGSYMHWDASLDKLCFVGTAQVDLGATADGIDVLFYGDTSGSYVMWDASDNRLEFVESKMDMTTLTETNTDPGRQIYLQRTYTGAASTAGLTGIEVRSTFNGSANSANMEVKGGEFKARHTNDNTKNVGTFKGVIGNCDSKTGGKTITSAWAVEGQIDCGTGSTITTAAGCRVAYNEDGTVTNAYGLYVDGTSVWDVGLKITASKTTTAIDIGACTTGINFAGATTTAINLSSASVDNTKMVNDTRTNASALTGTAYGFYQGYTITTADQGNNWLVLSYKKLDVDYDCGTTSHAIINGNKVVISQDYGCVYNGYFHSEVDGTATVGDLSSVYGYLKLGAAVTCSEYVAAGKFICEGTGLVSTGSQQILYLGLAGGGTVVDDVININCMGANDCNRAVLHIQGVGGFNDDSVPCIYLEDLRAGPDRMGYSATNATENGAILCKVTDASGTSTGYIHLFAAP